VRIIRCPICKKGEMLESSWPFAWCSRRYDEDKPCDFESPYFQTAYQYKAYVAEFRIKKLAKEAEAKARTASAR
jgi:hypothetical protein